MTEHRVTAGPYTLVIPPNGRPTLYEADQAGIDHEVPWGVGSFDALVQFAGEVIRLRAHMRGLDERIAVRSAKPPDENAPDPSADLRALADRINGGRGSL